MENFRQFKGLTKIDFSCDSQKNVSIILGDNTYGKTTLLQAFNWCFYGKTAFNESSNNTPLLNLELINVMDEGSYQNVEVEIVLLHDNTEYKITRSQQYCIKGGELISPSTTKVKLSYKQPDGQTEVVPSMQISKIINNILPEDLSTYFFFDTERVNNISQRKDVSESVKGLLGLSVMENAIHHLGSKTLKRSVIGNYYSNMDHEGNEKAKNALIEIQSAEDKKEAIEKRIQECNTQIKQYEDRAIMLEDTLRENEATKQLQEKKEVLEGCVQADENRLDESRNIYLTKFSQGALSFFIQPLLARAEDILRSVNIEDKGVTDITQSSIKELLARGKCICGCELKEGDEAYNHLIEELSYVPPESIGTTVRLFRDKLNTISKPAVYYPNELHTHYIENCQLLERIQENVDVIDDISERIKGKENIGRYEQELREAKKRIRELNSKKEDLIRDTGKQQKLIEQYKKLNDSTMAATDKNKEINNLMEWAEKIRDWLKETYSAKEVEIREALEIRVNEIFNKMYHGHRRVSIDDKYNVSLLTSVSDKEVESGESEGSNRVKNFAFIGGLVSLAKDKLRTGDNEDDFILSAEPYPLVMDAPFSNADEKHTENISKVLPETAEQIIMFVMKKDWRYAEPVLADRIGARYHLIKLSETNTRLEIG